MNERVILVSFDNNNSTSGRLRQQGVVAFWHVDDVKSTFEKLKRLGAKEYEKITEREDGFITASVIDPFGNILGIMYNPHYLEILSSLKK